jgi:hypothetical protein
MNAGKAVYGILSANSGVTDIVSTRIFPEIAEQEAATPFIVYQLQSVDPDDTHDGPSKLDEVRFEFICYADSYNQAADLGEKVRGALDRVSGTYNGVNVESVQFNDVDVNIEYDPRRYSQVLTFTFRIKRDDITIALGTPVTGAVLGDLSDVDVSGVRDGQVIAYNDSTENWEAANAGGGATTLDELTDTQVSGASPGTILSWNGSYWVPIAQSTPPSTTDALTEGTTNLYYTEARVSANTDVAANTAKVGITTDQANAITANTAKTSFPGFGTTAGTALEGDTALLQLGTTSSTALAGDTTTISTAQANAITANTAKTSFPGFGTTAGTALEGNTTTITTDQASAITANTAKTSFPGFGTTAGTALEGDTALLQIGTTAGTALEGDTTTITTDQANAITANTAKNSYPTADATKLAGIEEGAEVNVNADWTAASGDAQILNKPTLATVATSGSYTDLSNKPTIPADIGDLSDVPASLGTAGQVLAVNAGATALEYVDQSGGGATSFDYARAIMGSDVLQGGGSQQDFDSATAQKVKFNTSSDTEGSNITIDTTNNRITVGATGYYQITSNISFTSAASRTTPASFFKVNGTTDLLGEGYGYIRVASGQDDNNNLITCTVELQANDYVEVWTADTSTTGGACYATQAFFEIGSAGGAAGTTGAQGPSGTSYDVTTLTGSTTLSSSHTTKYLVCNSASAMNLTVPASASYDTYAEFVIEQRGAGQVTVVADTGVTIHSTETLKSGAQYAVMGLKRTDTNTYVLTGEREAAP